MNFGVKVGHKHAARSRRDYYSKFKEVVVPQMVDTGLTKLGISFVYMMPFHLSELRRAFRDLYRQCSIMKTITYLLNVATLTNLLV